MRLLITRLCLWLLLKLGSIEVYKQEQEEEKPTLYGESSVITMHCGECGKEICI